MRRAQELMRPRLMSRALMHSIHDILLDDILKCFSIVVPAGATGVVWGHVGLRWCEYFDNFIFKTSIEINEARIQGVRGNRAVSSPAAAVGGLRSFVVRLMFYISHFAIPSRFSD